MAQMDDTGNVQPIRTIDDEAALDWLRAQPGGRTKLSDAELGRRWGWKRQRVGRRVKAWAKDGRITRRGNTITYADLGAVVPPSVPPAVPSLVPPLVPPVVPPRAVKDVHPAAPPSLAPDTGARTSGRRHGAVIDVVAYTAAVALAGAAAWFSIRGMVVLFPGSPNSVIAMAVAMEAAKLITAGWLARRWRATALIWRAALAAFVFGLAVINAAGVYAQLVAAHVGDRGAATSRLEEQTADIDAKISVQAHTVADLDRRLAQIDTAVEKATEKGRTTAAMKLADDQRRARAGLVDERKREAGTLAALQAERASVAAKGRQIETEAAPIRYVAELVGADTDSEKAIRWLIALMVLCCDPLAIALTAAASARRA
jgi:hypothetical protein